MVALLDTNILFAVTSARDEHHDTARDIVSAIDHGDLPDAIVTNYVVAETLNLIGERSSPEAATEMLDRLIEGTHFDISHAPQADFTAAQALFRRYSGLSFIDATIAAYMQREDIEYLYSVDDDFDAVDWVTRLNTATNPYSNS